MKKIEKLKSNFDSLDDEISNLSSLYNLHFLQAKSLYINAILDTYQHESNLNIDDEYNTVTQMYNHQFVFYNTLNKKQKTVNISTEMFSKIWKNYLKLIEDSSIENMTNELYNTLKDKNFVSVEIVKVTRQYTYMRYQDENNFLYNKIIFRYKNENKMEREFAIKNSRAWIYISDKILNKIKNKSSEIVKLKEPMTINTALFHHKIAIKILSELLEKIRTKTKGKIDISIVNVNTRDKTIILKSDIFIPLEFINYINSYLYQNTMHKIFFKKNRSQKGE